MDVIFGQVRYHIYHEGGQWHRNEESSNFSCGECYEELDSYDAEEVLRAVGLL